MDNMKPRLAVKNIKTFNGHDGVGLDATLYFDGKKVCHVFDDARGGEVEYHWVGATRAEADAIEAEVQAYVATLPTKFIACNLSADHLKPAGFHARPELACPKCGKNTVAACAGFKEPDRMLWEGELFCTACNEVLEFVGNTLDTFINLAVEIAEVEKTFKRKCKTGTLIRRAGFGDNQYVELTQGGKKVVFTPELKTTIMKAYPDCIEIINERFA